MIAKSIQLVHPDGDSSAAGADEVGPPGQGTFEQLYAVHGRAIFSHCLRLLGDTASAEDASQEVFLRARRGLGRAFGVVEMRQWLFRVATNHCLNELRRRLVRSRVPPQLTELWTTNLEDSLTARNEVQHLWERLPPRVRAVAWLTYVDGMLQHEVAAALGVSRRTVVNDLTLVRARARPTSRERWATFR